MAKALVKLAYKQIIDASSTGDFAQTVFNDTYDEFLLQVQAYNREGAYKTFGEVVAHNPKAASLHYKVGFAIGLYVKDLQTRIPHLQDTLGRISLPFESYKFELIDSDITNKSAHKVALIYWTNTLTLFTTIGEYMVLAIGDQSKSSSKEPAETFLLRIEPNLSIATYSEQDSPGGSV